MSMFGPKMGSWYVSSETDPRWNNSGRAEGLVWDGGPEEMKKWIAKCKRKFGKPPKDCTCGFMKD